MSATNRCSELEQGDVYDDAGNKSVANLQISGDITILPTGSSVEYTPMEESLTTANLSGGFHFKNSSTKCWYEQGEFHSHTPGCYARGWGGNEYYTRTRDVSVVSSGTLQKWSGSVSTLLLNEYETGNLLSYKREYEGTFSGAQREGSRFICDASYSGVETITTIARSDGTVKVSSRPVKWTGTVSRRQLVGGIQLDPPGVYSYVPTALALDIKSACTLAMINKGAWSEMTQTAVESANAWDNNMLALIHDIVNLKGDLSSLVETFKDLDHKVNILTKTGYGWRQTSKAAAGAYLGNKYGYGLTVEDCWTVGEAIRDIRRKAGSAKYGIQKLRSRKTISVQTSLGSYTAEMALMARVGSSDKGLMSLIRSAMSWDLYPTTANMWDFVPYSFVVDWFVDVGGLLETLDAAMEKKYLPLRSLTKSVKTISPQFDASRFWGARAGGSVNATYYRRFPQFEWDPLVPSLQPGSGLDGHFLESSALLIQRFK